MSVVLLADLKAYLNITVTTDDTELQATLDAAEAAIGNRIGPLAPTSVSERVVGNTGPLSLRWRPVISLTSVTPSYGPALDITNLDVDPVSGLVAFKGYWSSFVSYFPMAWYQVVYQAGYQTLPADLQLAVKELARHFWETQRGAVTRPGALVGEPSVAAYSWPNRVLELIAPYELASFA